jgi:prophage regulatory protein
MTDTPDRILRLKTVLDRTGLSRSTLYRKMQNGTFPKNVQISERCAGWRESAINAWARNPMFYQATDHADRNDHSSQRRSFTR